MPTYSIGNTHYNDTSPDGRVHWFEPDDLEKFKQRIYPRYQRRYEFCDYSVGHILSLLGPILKGGWTVRRFSVTLLYFNVLMRTLEKFRGLGNGPLSLEDDLKAFAAALDLQVTDFTQEDEKHSDQDFPLPKH